MARTRSGVDVAVFADTEEIVKVDNVLVDESLPMSLISKSMVNDLGVEYEAAEHGDCQDEDSDEVKTIIGKVELQWHRRGSGRSHRELFNVVDTTSSLFVLKSLPKEGSEVFSFGLDQVTEGNRTTVSFVLLESFTLLILEHRC